jgi:plastocyanin
MAAGAMIRAAFFLYCLVFFTSGFPLFSQKPAPKTHTVQIIKMQFTPAELKVSKGDTVVFRNMDMVTHDATEASGKTWKSPALAAGKSWHMVATQSASYFCSFHPVMKGKILVQ